MDTLTIIQLAVCAVIFALSLTAHCILKSRWKDWIKALPQDEAEMTAEMKKALRQKKKRKRIAFFIMLLSLWYLAALCINLVTGGPIGIEVQFEMFSSRIDIFGVSVSGATVITYYIIAVVLILSLLFRFLVFPRFRETPRGVQNVIEIAVEAVEKFTKSTVGDLSETLGSYMFAVAVLLIGCAAAELLGQRPPTADLLMTLSLGLCTFFLLNYYGIRKKGIGGRIKSLASPNPMIFPMKVLSDIAVPVSLACRLFGNMLGGMIVMELLKSSLGGYSVGITSLAGIYFNLFHPLIQTYIFIVLSLTFINEAAE